MATMAPFLFETIQVKCYIMPNKRYMDTVIAKWKCTWAWKSTLNM